MRNVLLIDPQNWNGATMSLENSTSGATVLALGESMSAPWYTYGGFVIQRLSTVKDDFPKYQKEEMGFFVFFERIEESKDGTVSRVGV